MLREARQEREANTAGTPVTPHYMRLLAIGGMWRARRPNGRTVLIVAIEGTSVRVREVSNRRRSRRHPQRTPLEARFEAAAFLRTYRPA